MMIPRTAELQAYFAPLFDFIDQAGELIIIKEFISTDQPLTAHAAIKAKPNPLRLEDLVEGTLAKQGDFFLICRANSFPVARKLEQKDRVFFRGRDHAIINDDANQYAIGGVVYARVLHVRG